MTTPTMRLLTWAKTRGPDVHHTVCEAIEVAQQAHGAQLRRSSPLYQRWRTRRS